MARQTEMQCESARHVEASASSAVLVSGFANSLPHSSTRHKHLYASERTTTYTTRIMIDATDGQFGSALSGGCGSFSNQVPEIHRRLMQRERRQGKAITGTERERLKFSEEWIECRSYYIEGALKCC